MVNITIIADDDVLANEREMIVHAKGEVARDDSSRK